MFFIFFKERHYYRPSLLQDHRMRLENIKRLSGKNSRIAEIMYELKTDNRIAFS